MKKEIQPKDVNMIKPEQMASVDVVVFDMDGTLYELDGEDGGFVGSSLHLGIRKASIAFIIAREQISEGKAQDILTEALLDEVGPSNFLSRRYGMTRKEFFDIVWDLDPTGIVQNFEPAVGAISHFAKKGKKLILLTAAPEIWQKRVLEFLGISDKFFRTYTAEMFGHKKDVFSLLANEFDPKSVVSVGDQLQTDILPAAEKGMHVFLVKSPKSLEIFVEKEGL